MVRQRREGEIQEVRVSLVVQARRSAADRERQQAQQWTARRRARRDLDLLGEEFRHDLLTKDDIDTIEVVRPLGEGTAGRVDLIRFRGDIMVMKTLKMKSMIRTLLKEIAIHKKLAGAGGAPLFHGLCLRPARMIMSFSGRPYDAYIMKCSLRQVLDSLVTIGLKIQELHDKAVIHNDLKSDNFTVSTHGTIDFHVIDFGLSEEEGDILYSAGDPEEQFWMAPEVLQGQPVSPAGDVFSFGHFIQDMITFIEDQEVKHQLEPLFVRATDADPSARPTLLTLVDELRTIAESVAE
ncbi:dual specificity testis-specific protein kinase 2-like [Panulirus ornatus]|uniref:dual specificity testis-specific protein kinase 2-like n=1 Tax=Panulirus ornatus TaxID=150431 RepID=UPI003A8AF114